MAVTSLHSFIFLTLMLHCVQLKHTPMAVAFLCGKPALYLTSEGWMQDPTQDCLQEATDIVTYCSKIYGGQSIKHANFSSVVEIKLQAWCSFGINECDTHEKVNYLIQPWICSANKQKQLDIPPGCQLKQFGFTSGTCHKKLYWDQLIKEHCQDVKGISHTKQCIKAESYTHLHFLGVDFVCCDAEVQQNKSIHRLPHDAYQAYLENPSDEPDKVHERNKFNAAKKEHQEIYNRRVAQLEQRLIEGEKNLTKDDWLERPESTQHKEAELHENFRREYIAIRLEAKEKSDEIRLKHQTQMWHLMKRREQSALSNWDKVTSGHLKDLNLTQVLTAVDRLLHVVENNRHHLIKRFEHQRNTNPRSDSDGQHSLHSLRVQLREADRILNGSLKRLDHIAQFKQTVLNHVDHLRHTKYAPMLAATRSLLASVSYVDTLLPSFSAEVALEADQIISKHRHRLIMDGIGSKVTTSSNSITDAPVLEASPVHTSPQPAVPSSVPSQPRTTVLTLLSTNPTGTSDAPSNQQTTEVNKSIPLHLEMKNQEFEPPTSRKQNIFWPIMISAMVILLAVVVIAFRHRLRRAARLRQAGYSQPPVVEVDEVTAGLMTRSNSSQPTRTAGSRGLSNWRLNGYTNPAYRFPSDGFVQFS